MRCRISSSDNIFVTFWGRIQQTIYIPIGTNCACLLAVLFLHSHDAKFGSIEKKRWFHFPTFFKIPFLCSFQQRLYMTYMSPGWNNVPGLAFPIMLSVREGCYSQALFKNKSSPSLRKLYRGHHELVDRYGISVQIVVTITISSFVPDRGDLLNQTCYWVCTYIRNTTNATCWAGPDKPSVTHEISSCS